MKNLKFDHHTAELILRGEKISALRLFDDKDLVIDDQVSIVDKVVQHDPATWRSIGIANITKIIQKHLGDVTLEEAKSEGCSSRDELLEVYRKRYGYNVTVATPAKLIFFTFTPLARPLKDESLLHTKKAIVYADGASRGNPGPSAAGYVIYDEQHTLLATRGSYLGVTTNNQAEYTALKLGLEEAKQLGARDVQVYMDSLLVVNQMKGTFKVTNRDLWPIHEAVKEQCTQFEQVLFTQIPRELNKMADAAANKVLDAQTASTGI
jgi:ribonuclease HI